MTSYTVGLADTGADAADHESAPHARHAGTPSSPADASNI